MANEDFSTRLSCHHTTMPPWPGQRGLTLEEINSFFIALQETAVMLEISSPGEVSVAGQQGETRHK